eukprot:c16235_g1_i1 orf=156-725(+)
MVKRKTVREKISKKEAKKLAEKDAVASTSLSEDVDSGSSIHSNSSLCLKRKLTKKMQFLSKLQETQSVLGTKKLISKKKRGNKKSALNSLSILAEVLPSFKEKSLPKQLLLPRRHQARARQQLVVSEAKQLSKVLGHPQFKSSPFTAIHEHLVNTLGPVLGDRVKPLNKERADKRRNRRKKKKNNDMEE